jgi:large subunit ribosomal protein L23
MADITDIKSILYTEKTIELQEKGVIVVQTSPKMTKNGLKEVFKEYFGVTPKNINSLRQTGKSKRFRGVAGKRSDFKKFYVTLPEGAQIANLSA